MAHKLTQISGIGERTAEILAEHGYKTVAAVAKSSKEALADVPGFSLTRAEKTIAAAKSLQLTQSTTTAKTKKAVGKPESVPKQSVSEAGDSKVDKEKQKTKQKDKKKDKKNKNKDKQKRKNNKKDKKDRDKKNKGKKDKKGRGGKNK